MRTAHIKYKASNIDESANCNFYSSNENESNFNYLFLKMDASRTNSHKTSYYAPPVILRGWSSIILSITITTVIFVTLHQVYQHDYCSKFLSKISGGNDGSRIYLSNPKSKPSKEQHVLQFANYKQTSKKLSATDQTCRGEWSSSKNKYYSDRIQNSEKLYLGEFICSTNGIYKFGLDKNGDFIWMDTSQKEGKQKNIYFRYGKDISDINYEDYYILLKKDGEFAIFDDSETKSNKIWSMECEREVSYTDICLQSHSIDYSCPYLHIHSGGKVVLNYIDDNWDWIARDVVRVYGLETED